MASGLLLGRDGLPSHISLDMGFSRADADVDSKIKGFQTGVHMAAKGKC